MSWQNDVPRPSGYPTDKTYSQIPPELFDEMRPAPKAAQRLHIRDVSVAVTGAQRVPRLHVWGAGGDSPYGFAEMRQGLLEALLRTTLIDRGRWQTLDVSGSEPHKTFELRNVALFYTPPSDILALQDDVKPDLPWADAHFEERVGGEPVNPPPSFVQWPHHNGSADLHVTNEVFSHTYPERFWPKHAGDTAVADSFKMGGIRFAYGDLGDVVTQLVKNPMTRQAVLPVWFPEDTGATDRRVPCTLTYHFMADNQDRLSMWYSMRACDFSRHFHNDVYFAARLLQWVVNQVNDHRDLYEFSIGEVNMTISSLHLFKGDAIKMGYSG